MTRSGRAGLGAASTRLAGAVAPAAIVVAFVALVVLALLPTPGSAAGGIELEITECGTEEQPTGCSTESQRIERAPERQTVQVAPKSRPAAAPPAAERHDVDL